MNTGSRQRSSPRSVPIHRLPSRSSNTRRHVAQGRRSPPSTARRPWRSRGAARAARRQSRRSTRDRGSSPAPAVRAAPPGRPRRDFRAVPSHDAAVGADPQLAVIGRPAGIDLQIGQSSVSRVTRVPCTRSRPASRVPSQISPSGVSAIEMTNEARHRCWWRDRREPPVAIGECALRRAWPAGSRPSRPRSIAVTTASGGPTSGRMFSKTPCAIADQRGAAQSRPHASVRRGDARRARVGPAPTAGRGSNSRNVRPSKRTSPFQRQSTDTRPTLCVMALTAPPGNPDSAPIGRGCTARPTARRPAPRAGRQRHVPASSQAPARADARRRQLRQVLEPLDDNLDVLLRGLRRVPEVVEVHAHALSARRRNTRGEFVLRNLPPHRRHSFRGSS